MSVNQLAEHLNTVVINNRTNLETAGFVRAFDMAGAIKELRDVLTVEVMIPIMELQGSRLGFKTDKDRENGYSVEIVRNCLIEAVLTGLEPTGNQFNIIAANMYVTKEGFGHLLGNHENLWYEINPGLPTINQSRTSALIKMKLEWQIKGSSRQIRELEIPIRLDKRIGIDAIIGKATRKTRCWLWNTITGSQITDGDAAESAYVQDAKYAEEIPEIDEELKSVSVFVDRCTTSEELDKLFNEMSEDKQLVYKDLIEEKRARINTKENEGV